MSMRYPGGFIASTPVTAGYPSGVWTQAQALPYQAQNVWTRDQFWPYTSLLLNGNGTNGAQNNTFLDSSTNNFTITRNGNTTQGSFTPYEAEGYWSNYFEGTSNTNYLSIARLLDSTVDITLECWIYMTAADPTNGAYIAAQFTSGGADRTIFSVSVGLIGMQFGGVGISGVIPIPRNQWVHLAWVRSGNGTNNWSQYVNGIRDGQMTYTGTYQNTPFTIGASNNIASSQFPGYISNMRLLKGTALYSGASFTPPSAPLTAITNTVLLTAQGNRFVDSSASPNTITVNGSPSVQAFQPFPGATTYSGTVLGGSGYFDGTGDFLDIADNAAFSLGTNNFTIDLWVYQTANNISYYFSQNTGTASTSAFDININNLSLNTTVYYGSSFLSLSGGTITLNSWNHIAVSRSGSNMSLYLNGARVATSAAANVNINNSATSVRVSGINSTPAYNVTAYVADVRLVNGTAVYDPTLTTLTIPTAPLTAITNTSLLLNFTNAGIADSATMNDLETVGNAQVSTSVVKYGTGSMAFDGNGDYLTAVTSDLFRFPGDFTIEMWANPSSFSIIGVLFDTRVSGSSTTGVSASFGTDGKLNYFADNANRITSAAAYSTGVWYHIAFVRSGSVTTMYVNGTSVGTYSASTNYSDGAMTIGTSVDNRAATTTLKYNGYIDDLRITKGVARYITNFTPPPARLPGQ